MSGDTITVTNSFLRKLMRSMSSNTAQTAVTASQAIAEIDLGYVERNCWGR